MKMAVANIENARIGFRNFEGREGPYNRKGERSFAVFLDRQTAEAMAEDGWNVKFPKPNPNNTDPDQDERDPHLTIAVSTDQYPAIVNLISNGRPTRLTGDEIGMLDWAEIESTDLVIRPYEYTVNGKSGVKAYLKAGYFNIIVDQFASKYGL